MSTPNFGSKHPLIFALITAAVTGAVTAGVSGVITNAQTQSAAVEEIARRFDAVEETMSFNEALETVYEEYSQAKKELEDVRSDDDGRKAVAEADVKWAAGDYSGALTVLRAAADSPTAYEKYCEYSTQYVSIVLGQAREAKANRDFDGAERILNGACGLVVDDSQLRKELDALQHRTTKKLGEMTAGDSSHFEEAKEVQKDTVGNSYSPDNTFLLEATRKESHGFASFYLGGEYSTMGGVIAVSDKSSKNDQNPYAARFEVRGKTKSGGESVLWSSGLLTRTTAPVVLPDIDVSGIEWLEVRAYWDDGRDTYNGITVILDGFEFFDAS